MPRINIATASRKEVLKYCIERLKSHRQRAQNAIQELEQRIEALLVKDTDDAIALEALQKELTTMAQVEFKAKAKRGRRR